MTKKRQSYAIDRRKVRRREKNSTIQRDKTIGKVCRRGYGSGIAS
jgi:hypothetical protein